MLEDVLNESQKVVIEGKTYEFEFDHAALAILEKNSGKSSYEFFDILANNKHLMLNDVQTLVYAGLLRNHKSKEVSGFVKKLIKQPGLWHEIKEHVLCAFLSPMLPPEILRNLENKIDNKKKRVKQR